MDWWQRAASYFRHTELQGQGVLGDGDRLVFADRYRPLRKNGSALEKRSVFAVVILQSDIPFVAEAENGVQIGDIAAFEHDIANGKASNAIRPGLKLQRLG